MTVRNAIGWVSLGFGGLILSVLVWGIFSPTLPTSTAWWPLVVVAAGIGIKYVFGANKLGLFVTVLGVTAFLAFSVFGVDRYLPGGTEHTSVTAGEQSLAAREAAERERQRQAAAIPTTAASLWADLNRWLTGQGLPDAITLLIILVAVATVLYGIYAVATNGAGKWPARIGGTTLALALAYGGAIGLIGKERTDAYLAYASQSIPAPGSPAEGGAGGGTSAPARQTAPALNADAVTMPWTRATTLAFHALPRDQGCIRWSIDTSSFEAFQAHLQASNRTNAERQFQWEARGGGVGPKPGEQLQEWARSRSPTVFIQTLPC